MADVPEQNRTKPNIVRICSPTTPNEHEHTPIGVFGVRCAHARDSRSMKSTDQALKDGAACALELASRRGSASLEKAWARLTLRRRALLPATFIEILRTEAAQRAVTR